MASGDPTTTSVVLWTRVEPADPTGDVMLRWTIEPADPGGAAGGPATSVGGQVVAAAARDHTAHVPVTGLDPGTSYRFAFHVDGAPDGERAAGLTRTLPADVDRLRIAFVCCARWGWNDFAAYDALVDDDPDVVVHLGDYIYEIGEVTPEGTVTDPPHEARTLSDYRRRYASHRRHPALRRLHERMPILALWDDHEVADNSPTDDDPVAAQRRADGIQAWSEWTPLRVADEPAPLDRHLSIGSLVDLHVIDTRFSGREPHDTDGPVPQPTGRQIMSDAQWHELADGLRPPNAPWIIVANQVQVGTMRLGAIPALRPLRWRPLVNPDQWDGFPEERERLYDLLAGVGDSDVLVVSGDLHSAWSRTLSHRGTTVGHELTVPSVAGLTYAGAFREQTHLPAAVLERAIRLFNGGIDLLELDVHGYVRVDVSPDDLLATFVLVHPPDTWDVRLSRSAPRSRPAGSPRRD